MDALDTPERRMEHIYKSLLESMQSACKAAGKDSLLVLAAVAGAIALMTETQRGLRLALEERLAKLEDELGH